MRSGVKFITFFVLIFVLLVITACGGDKDETDSDGKVTLKISDWSDSVKDIREEFHKKFMEKHPNIEIEYTQLTADQFKNTILTSIQSGEAPDLFPVPNGMELSTVVEDGWYQSIDPYIGDDFKDLFVDGALRKTTIDGKLYAVPEAKEMPDGLVFYNKELFEKVGLDPENPPKTYAEFREAAKKITEEGNGDFYGMIEGGKQTIRWQQIVRNWASLAGSGINKTSPINMATGEPGYDAEPVTGVYNLIDSLVDDGSFHPKTMSISAPEARDLFAQGQAGFLVQGAWSIGVWKNENPDLDFGVMSPPLPESGRKGSLPIKNPKPWLGIYSNSEHPEEAALYLEELYGGDYFQKARAKKGDSFSVVKGIDEEYIEIQELLDFKAIVDEYGALVPDPIVRNPDTSAVFAEYNDVFPNFGDIMGSLVSGSIEDAEKSLEDYSNKIDDALSEAIKKAQDKGNDVSKSDFEFTNWNLMEDYTIEEYDKLN
ncbi:Cyclodextrin-binding protein precursor [Paraliobacillus sp. PM-2]|uniref:ABC transporter substrate-binding protein n=1 Tax=Paraliobacillus sp. PM-2 TaxID=1462524 RepID=UPI00061C34DE|nr:sugar ABC transporter substrate-binding protein [Paraliobacillus sp. PM-2]CQR47232.1 Cyclodextrin-binding protein precursor [Paraliobacillus sp. PM-2]